MGKEACDRTVSFLYQAFPLQSFLIKTFLKEAPPVETILQAIGNVGFPIVVTAYLLVRIENKLEGLAASITSLANVIDKNQ